MEHGDVLGGLYPVCGVDAVGALGALIAIPLSLGGWLSVLVGMAGIVALSLPEEFKRVKAWLTPATGLGLLSGFCFALTALSIHYSSRQLSLPPVHAAGVVLVSMMIMQLVLMTVWLAWREPGLFRQIPQHLGWAVFIGLTSALGSIGWYTAMSLQNPALVKTLGQVEFFFTLFITWRLFKEPIRGKEWVGMGLILASVILLLRV
ncbi:DMT family transporter [Salinispirillum sp. LH 10-3-1]|uniref:DMT family transporter n=1 Tax=Salinispirillum sp. LH 10-3-1 TaxID=2952525 RepID=A0AB38YCM4_9GAMM